MNATLTDWRDELRAVDACSDALEFAHGFETFQAAWDACERGDHLLWWCGRLSGPPESDGRKRLVRVACQCARLALSYVKPGEERPLRAIETAERWASGEGVTLQNVRRAAAYAAYAATNAADAAAYAAYAAAAATNADAAYAAAYAAYAATNAAARSQARASVLKQCADLVRAEYPRPPVRTR